MIFKSLTFWTLVAGLLAFVAKFLFPTFPLDAAGILAAILFVLGLIGVVPAVRANRASVAMGASADWVGLVNSLAFWQLVAGILYFVVKFFAPNFPMDQGAILAVIVFVLGFFGVTPELRVRGLR
jgi:NADH:ubiquinone oxidoreductase subunit K